MHYQEAQFEQQCHWVSRSLFHSRCPVQRGNPGRIEFIWFVPLLPWSKCRFRQLGLLSFITGNALGNAGVLVRPVFWWWTRRDWHPSAFAENLRTVFQSTGFEEGFSFHLLVLFFIFTTSLGWPKQQWDSDSSRRWWEFDRHARKWARYRAAKCSQCARGSRRRVVERRWPENQNYCWSEGLFASVIFVLHVAVDLN